MERLPSSHQLPSPTPRTKFLFMHLADPSKAPVKGNGRTKSEVGRMLRRPPGQEDFGGQDDLENLGTIDPVLKKILGMGQPDREQERMEQPAEEMELQETSEDGGSEKDFRETSLSSGGSESSTVSRGPRGAVSRGVREEPSRRRNPLRTPAFSNFMDDFPVQHELNKRILQAAGVGVGSAAAGEEVRLVPANEIAPPSALYSTKRAQLKEVREKKIQKRMMEMVHKGTMPPELLLDDDLAKSSKMDADNFEDDPDAYDTDELLGSDVESIPSTDSEDDERVIEKRERLRHKRRRQKSKALRKKKRDVWAKKRHEIEQAKSRYYDDMIDQLVFDNPSLRPPHVSSDIETKRSFVDRATAENMTRSKIEQMARWIRVIGVVVENLGMITGFLMLDGLSVAIDEELRKPEMQPIIAQLARKYLRRGPSSPEWALAIMFIGSVGTIHAYNVKQNEAQEQSRGNGSATGPGSSKFSKLISGATKIMKAVGIFGNPGTASTSSTQPPTAAASKVASRYSGAGETAPRQALPRPKPEPDSEDDDEVSLDTAPWGS